MLPSFERNILKVPIIVFYVMSKEILSVLIWEVKHYNLTLLDRNRASEEVDNI